MNENTGNRKNDLPGPYRYSLDLAGPGAASGRMGRGFGVPPAATGGRYGASSASVAVSYPVLKRILDVAVATTALALLAPVLAVIALLVWAEDRGPVIYSQERVGRDGRRFRFFKFRSMVRNADALRAALDHRNEARGPIFKMRHDPRVTRVGRVLRKYSLDELPQFFNVLRGDMSLVGPRPHLPREVALYEGEQARRLSVPPGLICLREVTGRSQLTFEQWVELDLEYVRHRCLALDLRILLMAVPAVLRAEGAY